MHFLTFYIATITLGPRTHSSKVRGDAGVFARGEQRQFEVFTRDNGDGDGEKQHQRYQQRGLYSRRFLESRRGIIYRMSPKIAQHFRLYLKPKVLRQQKKFYQGKCHGLDQLSNFEGILPAIRGKSLFLQRSILSWVEKINQTFYC